MIYDITPPITDKLTVWPGDVPLSREILCDMNDGAETTSSALRATAHLGAHADAPSHYGLGVPGIEGRSIDYYLGRCQVISVKACPGAVIGPDSVCVPITAARVLFHTATFPDPTVFSQDFAALSPSLVESLSHQGVRLIGIDTPSVDPFESKDLPSHKMCLKHNVAILEGLVLTDVPEGIYELIALPLKLIGFDASPVRAVLRTLD